MRVTVVCQALLLKAMLTALALERKKVTWGNDALTLAQSPSMTFEFLLQTSSVVRNLVVG